MINQTPLTVVEYDGKPIDKPGIYSGVPMARYHHNLCIGPSVSSGVLRKLEDECPSKAFETSYLNPNRKPQKDTEALLFGRATHHLFGGERGFLEQFAIRPDTYPTDPSKPWNGNAKDCRAWLAERELEGKSVLKPDAIDHIRAMAERLSRHSTIQQGILGGIVEASIVWQDEATGIWLKARPDTLPLHANMIVDLKTAETCHPVSVRRAIADRSYHMQLALIDMGLRAVAGRQMTDFVLVFIEKTPPYAVNIKPLDPNAIWWGRRQLRRSIDLFAKCVGDMATLKAGDPLEYAWPDYDDDEVPCDLPDYLLKRLMAEAEAGILPDVEN